MISRVSLYILLGLLLIVLGGIGFLYRGETQWSSQVYPAVINRDCAPWDGSAFTVSIPLHDGVSIAISIYRPPEIKVPAIFSFPDESMRDGNALLLPPVGSPKQLTGKLWFQRVEQGISVEARFQLQSETGAQFEGRFIAEWGNQVIYCG